MQENVSIIKEEVITKKEVIMKTVKLINGDDIRCSQLPIDSSLRLVREIVKDRFPSLKGLLIKYRDQEGDLITITTTDELRCAEKSGESQNSFRLYIAEVDPEQTTREWRM